MAAKKRLGVGRELGGNDLPVIDVVAGAIATNTASCQAMFAPHRHDRSSPDFEKLPIVDGVLDTLLVSINDGLHCQETRL